VLNLKYPADGVPSRSASVPDGISAEPVLFDFATFVVSEYITAFEYVVSNKESNEVLPTRTDSAFGATRPFFTTNFLLVATVHSPQWYLLNTIYDYKVLSRLIVMVPFIAP
jgi:hypothetical protein